MLYAGSGPVSERGGGQMTAELVKRGRGRKPSRLSATHPGLRANNVAPVDSSVLSAQVMKAITEGLLDGRLRPGDRLVEADLADLLGVSRSPIREALTELTKSGLIVREPRKGCRIRDWTRKDLENLYGVRLLLEGYAARLAAPNIDSKSSLEFKKIIASMRQAANRNDYLAMIDLDLFFHETMWRLSGNSLLEEVLHDLSQQFRLFLTMNWKFHGGLGDVADNHLDLLNALMSGDHEKLDGAMRRHVVVEKMIAAMQG
jgi:DNA-binding GntR family transcriptional regulator